MAETSEQAILEAAKKVFMLRGYAGARMQEIADEAGINKAMLHYYFRSKEKLFKVIFEEIAMGLLPKLGAALEGEGTVLEKFEKVIRIYIGIIQKNPYIPMFILHELSQNRTEFVNSMKKKVTKFPNLPAFFGQIMEEQMEGKIKDVPPLHLLLNVMGMVIFPFLARPVVTNLLDMPTEQFDLVLNDRADVVVGFLKNALKP